MTPRTRKIVFPHVLDFLEPRVAHEIRYLICDLDLFLRGVSCGPLPAFYGCNGFRDASELIHPSDFTFEDPFENVHESHHDYTQLSFDWD